tara:strand:- start:168 stop:368 length:201 start_codon:yes stop_codon:yes gene_type:complete
MKNHKSVSVKSNTFDQIKKLTETLLPKVKLSHAQVIESAIQHCSHDATNKGNNDYKNLHKNKTSQK